MPKLMLFPRPLRVSLTHKKNHLFPQGLNSVPDEVVNSKAIMDYLELNGVKDYDPTQSPSLPVPENKQPATLEELQCEVLERGYSADASSRIAQERFDGLFGNDARYTAPGFVFSEEKLEELRDKAPGKTSTEPPASSETVAPNLDRMNKAELAAHALDSHGLSLDPDNHTKAELIDKIKAAQEPK